MMPDNPLQPSPEAEAILRQAGWSPDREVDTSEWVETLRDQGNEVFPLAEAIMKKFGGLRLRHREAGGPSRHDFDVNPSHWYDQRDRVGDIEEILGISLCPVGETSGAAMLAVLADGRVIDEFEGEIIQIGENWRAALDNLLLGRGADLKLAEDYEAIRHQSE
jgi:hypothetical protein